jgi:hypothetical protein
LVDEQSSQQNQAKRKAAQAELQERGGTIQGVEGEAEWEGSEGDWDDASEMSQMDQDD